MEKLAISNLRKWKTLTPDLNSTARKILRKKLQKIQMQAKRKQEKWIGIFILITRILLQRSDEIVSSRTPKNFANLTRLH